MISGKQFYATLAIAIIAITNGWHLAPVQGYAWLSMAADDVKSESFRDAIRAAIDGREMCGVCQYVVEQKQDSQDDLVGYWNMMPKWILAALMIPAIFFAKPRIWQRIPYSLDRSIESFTERVTPPPKVA